MNVEVGNLLMAVCPDIGKDAIAVFRDIGFLRDFTDGPEQSGDLGIRGVCRKIIGVDVPAFGMTNTCTGRWGLMSLNASA